MITLAYNIDPLLQEPHQLSSQAILDALPDLVLSMAGLRHLAITEDASLKIDWPSAQHIEGDEENQFSGGSGGPSLPLELIRLKIAPRFWQNPENVHKKALLQVLQSNQVKLWFTTNPKAVFNSGNLKTLLVATASTLLSRVNSPKKAFGNAPLPGWTQAAAIIVPHQADREALLTAYPQLAAPVKVIFPALEEPVQPLNWSEQEQLKLRYSGGRDYFLYAGELSAEQQLIHLLKAYSLVKKWLMTGMPLILAGQPSDFTPKLEKLLLTYKYRSDVSVFSDISQNDLKELVSGAYAMVHPASATTDTYSIQWAFSAGIPVIAVESKEMLEFCREAAQLCPPNDIEQLAHAMMLLYKDEYLRGNLIAKGHERAGEQNRLRTLEQYKVVIMGLLGDNG